MTLYNFEALKPAPDAAETLAVLAGAIGERIVSPLGRVQAKEDSRSTAEGLALLHAYVTIEDRRIRQAILDAVLAISGG